VKVIRSAKCSLKFATESKRERLRTVLEEYGRVCNFFIAKWWDNPPDKNKIRKIDIEDCETWFTTRLMRAAAFEALAMILAIQNKDGKIGNMPMHNGKSMRVSDSAIFQVSKSSSFDAWLHLHSLGNKLVFDLPIKGHQQFNKWFAKGRMMNSFLITEKYVKFSFEIETGPKKTEGRDIGIDTGIKSLATTSDGQKHGTNIESIINRINNCQHGSKHQRKLRQYLKDEMARIAKSITSEIDLKLIVVEGLKNMNHNTKKQRSLGKAMRKRLGTWVYRYWLTRIHEGCENNRVSFRSVSPYYTSQTCSRCGHVERVNRDKEKFRCRHCDYTDDADINAAVNILNRFTTGAFGPGARK